MKEYLVAFHKKRNTPKIRFIASLSDGRTVIEDNRPNEKSAWLRLEEFLRCNNNLDITCLRLQGPDGEVISMPKNQSGYFFGKKVARVFSMSRRYQINYVGIGFSDGHLVTISWYNTINFKDYYLEERTPEKAGFFLIKNNNVKRK